MASKCDSKLNFFCWHCKKTFTTEKRYKEHACGHCKLCNKTFSTKNRLNTHKCPSLKQNLNTEQINDNSFKNEMDNHENNATSTLETGIINDRGDNGIGSVNLKQSEFKTSMNEKLDLNDENSVNSKPKNDETTISFKNGVKNEETNFKQEESDDMKQSFDSDFDFFGEGEGDLNDVKENEEGFVKAVTFSTPFDPVDPKWQFGKCQEFNLLYVCPAFSDKTKECAGTPIDIEKMKPDGNCFFRSISYVLTGDQESHKKVRREICSFMQKSEYSRQIKKTLLSNWPSVAQYLFSKNMYMDGEWASEVEIYTAALMLRTKIYVFRNVQNRKAWHLHDPALVVKGFVSSPSSIYIDHPNNNHYDVVKDVAIGSDILTQSATISQNDIHLNNPSSPLFPGHLNKPHSSSKKIEENFQEFPRISQNDTNLNTQNSSSNISEQSSKTNNSKETMAELKRKYNKQYKAKQRMNQKFRSNESKSKKDRKAKQRLEPEFQSKERKTEKDKKAKQRLDPKFRSKERIMEKDQKSKKRLDPSFRSNENAQKKKRKTKGDDSEFRSEQVKRKSMDDTGTPQNRKRNRSYSKTNRSNEIKSLSELKKLFNSYLSFGPSFVCTSCNGLFYKHSVSVAPSIKSLAKSKKQEKVIQLMKRVFQGTKSVEDVEWVCSTCLSHLNKAQIPDLSSENGLQFPTVPPELQGLTALEERCISPRIPFMQVRELGCDHQFGIKGNVVNVPIDVPKTVTLLPRCLNDTETVALKLKRKLKYKTATHFENVRPGKIFAAAKWLTEHGDLYKEEGIKLDESWFKPEWENKDNVAIHPRDIEVDDSNDKEVDNSSNADESQGHDGNLQPSDKENHSQPIDQREGFVAREDCDDDLCIPDKCMDSDLKKEDCVSKEDCDNSFGIPDKCMDRQVIDNSDSKRGDSLARDDCDGNQKDSVAKDDFDDSFDFLDIPNDSQVIDNPDLNKEDCSHRKCGKEEEDNNDDDWDETEPENDVTCGNRDTLLHPEDFIADGQKALNIAPGEGKEPLGIFFDEDCEEKAFPTIYCGGKRFKNKPDKRLTYSKICKAELRNQDRRVANSVPNIFFKLKKLQMLQVRDLANVALRKIKGGKQNYNAGQLKKEGAIEALLHHDEGYRILKNIRSSPPYWEAKQKDIFAMMRQLGRPTFFATFSAAESKWLDLLRILYLLKYKVNPTDAVLENLSWQEKSQLIQSDPVTCARHFDYRVQVLINKVLYSELAPLGKITDHFFRSEFQQRGSPHIHCLFWVEGAPELDKDSDTDVAKFIDSYLTCKRYDSGELSFLTNLHEHKHSHTCKKNGKQVCRFGFPLFPMPQTMVLRPLLECDTEDKDKMDALSKILDQIKDEVSKLKPGNNMSFEELLAKLEIDQEMYIRAISSDLDGPKIFLRRNPSEIRMNSRNDNLAEIWSANTDVQFILDEYACAVYVATYISKSQRGMSNLLRDASEEIKQGNHGIRQQVRHISNKFLNHIEVSAQEAVYLLMQLPLCHSSRSVIFVNTGPKEERVGMLKKFEALEQMKDDETDITYLSKIERYAKRPEQLKHICLAEFATGYDIKTNPRKPKSSKNDNVALENEYEEDMTDNLWKENPSSGNEFKLSDGKILYKRTKSKILRSVGYSLLSDSENFYREQLMLYIPWEDDEKNILGDCQTYKERYEQLKDDIRPLQQKFQSNAKAVEVAKQQVQNDRVSEDAWDQVAPQAQNLESCQQENNTDSRANAAFQPVDEKHKNYDIGLDMGLPSKSDVSHTPLTNRISDDEYSDLVRNLNSRQKEFFYHILNWIKTKCSGSLSSCIPFYYFLSGGAGVGKSRCVLAIYYALVRYLNSLPGENPDKVKVLLTAPTGKAAYNIRGATLHSAFHLPASQSFDNYMPLDHGRRNSLRTILAGLRVLIIDEISMVGSSMFGYINQRLKEIMGCDSKEFGGVSVLCVGDLFQLKPVFDSWIFKHSTILYSAFAPILWHSFQMFELTEIMRQKDDKIFAETLNRVREGRQTKEDEEILNSRIVKAGNHLDNVIHLFTNNDLVSTHNSKILAANVSPAVSVEAVDVVVGQVPPDAKDKILQRAKLMSAQKTQGLFQNLTLKVGGRFMLISNVDCSDGLTNGATGTLKMIGQVGNQSGDALSVVWMEFDDESVGKNCRSKYEQLYTPGVKSSWTPIFKTEKGFRVGKSANVSVLRKQIPLAPCSAMTVHKAQGSTLEQVAMSFKGRAEQHLVYVAVSRAKSLQGLHFLDFDSNKIRVSPEVREEMERLRKNPVQPSLLNQLTNADDGFHIVFHNSRSLHKHIPDLRSEKTLLMAHFLFVSETWEDAHDDPNHYKLEGFDIIEKTPVAAAKHRPHSGTVLYARDDGISYKTEGYREKKIEIVTVDASSKVEGLLLIGIYCPPSVNTCTLKEVLSVVMKEALKRHTLFLIGGDFNSDAIEKLSKPLSEFSEEFGLRQIIQQCTTDFHSKIDLIFTNIPDSSLTPVVLESWYSDHKPCWVSIHL